eukprot:CAMPEP_0181188504 /NCGR_PEP_ID=MMETSP1096-20121128/11154_1 /TAXON_ID=156174 ORGANISM="Chrysochromulina ericina, Strain CCMP281" /NCGR_SAMPLE_ID=MMETSP1096 /ASSEMBLY_ACC=CAM_ASM_000453 /LENGTH=68 /DNA_ID=CAMNT_0023277575 /DNA_START=135 /DNA_END=343 /DNA_ORIENTATION=-
MSTVSAYSNPAATTDSPAGAPGAGMQTDHTRKRALPVTHTTVYVHAAAPGRHQPDNLYKADADAAAGS